jgi:hypothetical protein
MPIRAKPSRRQDRQGMKRIDYSFIIRLFLGELGALAVESLALCLRSNENKCNQ